jgi:predicted MFS family arabinose efflux permease
LTPSTHNTFYQYLGLHSLLIGIFPFYIPVFLWKQGFNIGDISFFIAIAGAGFIIGLWFWDRLRLVLSLKAIIAISLVLEVMLLLNVYMLGMDFTVLLALGLTYGAYNCFYWTTQRALFFDLIDIGTSGRKYGNFQIFVGGSLQLGIVIGGLLLEWTNFVYLLAASALIAVTGFLLISRSTPEYPQTLAEHDSLKVPDILGFKDREHSRFIFFADGFFLFAESFFWLITLFLLAHESFSTLGIIILSLAVIFGILFYLLKNIIDKLGKKRIYIFAVFLYVASWILRALIDESMPLNLLFAFLVAITFCTTFFRLAMNKRFYDLAKLTRSHDYLVLKSYYSQFAIVFVFGAFGFFSYRFEPSETLLVPLYWISAALAFVYLLYGSKRHDYR